MDGLIMDTKIVSDLIGDGCIVLLMGTMEIGLMATMSDDQWSFAI